ncbi:MAG TPA: hypothetical protein VGA61_08915, partial [Anaerolineae bacterium]
AARQIMSDIQAGRTTANVIGILRRGLVVTPLTDALAMMDWQAERPIEQMFLRWRTMAETLAKPGPGWKGDQGC